LYKKWVIVEWIEKRSRNTGVVVISPFEEGKLITGLALVTSFPSDEYNIIGEIKRGEKET